LSKVLIRDAYFLSRSPTWRLRICSAKMMQIGVPGCEEIRGSTLHALGMKILIRQNVLQATGRVARPLNRFETEPLLYDLLTEFGNKRDREKRIRAYEAAWARLQHEEPGYAANPQDRLFEGATVAC
jgi:DNA helicase-2/ATP-dependent DNA helicase PcrA